MKFLLFTLFNFKICAFYSTNELFFFLFSLRFKHFRLLLTNAKRVLGNRIRKFRCFVGVWRASAGSKLIRPEGAMWLKLWITFEHKKSLKSPGNTRRKLIYLPLSELQGSRGYIPTYTPLSLAGICSVWYMGLQSFARNECRRLPEESGGGRDRTVSRAPENCNLLIVR